MLTRRRVLAGASGGAVTLAGCLSLPFSDDELPVHFEIVNAREERFYAEVVFTAADGEPLFEGAFDVPAREDPEEDSAILFLQDVARVPAGDELHAELRLDDETFEERYEIACDEEDRADNHLRFIIRREPDTRLDDDSHVEEFVKNEC